MKRLFVSLFLTLSLTSFFQAACMEQQFSEAESLAIFVIAIKTYQITTETVQNLERLLQLDTKLLSEPTLDPEIKKDLNIYDEKLNLYTKCFKENPFFSGIFFSFSKCFAGITFLIKELKRNAASEQVINNYLEDYYLILGKLTVINKETRSFSKLLPESNE